MASRRLKVSQSGKRRGGHQSVFSHLRGGRVVRWYLVNFQCRGVLQILIIVEQGLTALTVDADGVCLDVFTLVYHFSVSLSLSARRPDID